MPHLITAQYILRRATIKADISINESFASFDVQTKVIVKRVVW